MRSLYNKYNYPSLQAPFHSKWPQGFLSRINMIIPFLTGIWRKKIKCVKACFEVFQLRHEKFYKTFNNNCDLNVTKIYIVIQSLKSIMILFLNEIYYAEIQRVNLNNVRENTFARTPDRKYLSSRTRAWKNNFLLNPEMQFESQWRKFDVRNHCENSE